MSAPVVTCEFSPDALARMQRITALGQGSELLLAAKAGLDPAAEIALDSIIAERFTGKGPFPADDGKLGVKTNRLRSSLRYVPAEISGDTMQAAMGSNVSYFGVHEFGYTGEVTVAAFSRRVSPTQFAKPGTGFSGKGAKAKRAHLGTETVRGHTRHMDMPARAPLGHGLADHLPELTLAMARSIAASFTA